LPTEHAVRLLVEEGGVLGQYADELARRRPYSGTDALPPDVLNRLLG
jgi:hypothetical protein